MNKKKQNNNKIEKRKSAKQKREISSL